jgi:hypothetical protein
MTHLSRRVFLSSGAAIGAMPALAASKQEAHRFRTADFDVEMTVEYHDRYSSRGFWFREVYSGKHFCLSADGVESRQCLTDFHGSLALAQYRVHVRSGDRNTTAMREYVRTVDRDARLRDRPPKR